MAFTGHEITAERIEQYAAKLKDDERAGNTVEKYVRDIRAFAKYLNGEPVTKENAVGWKNSLVQSRKATSVNSMLAAVNGYFEHAGLGIKVKQLRVQRGTFLPSESELTVAEYERLLGAAKRQGNERIRQVMQTLCATGIRVSELRYITAEAVQNGRAEVTNKGKTRTVLLPDELIKALSVYAKQRKIAGGSIFVTRNGKPVGRSNVWAEMKKLCAAAGVDGRKVRPHGLRSLFARTYYRATKDIAKLADIMGHSDLRTTRIYIMETDAEHRRAINSLGLVKHFYGT